MSLIEGVDDEVTALMTVIVMLMGLLVAWLSAQLSNQASTDNTQSSSQDLQPDGETQQVELQQHGGLVADELDAAAGEPVVSEPDDGDEDGANIDDNSSSQEAEVQEPEIPDPVDGEIRVKLKYLDDRIRCVRVPVDVQVGHFKRTHFAAELAQDLLVRLIHNGRELQPDTTLAAYNINDLSVIHCLVTPSNRTPNQQQTEAELTDLDLSNLMLPLFTLILALIWYCRVMYRNFFNAMSTLALVGITVLYLFTVVVTWRNNFVQQQQQQQQIGGANRRPTPDVHPHQE